jgi:dephospho-CoA kinase
MPKQRQNRVVIGLTGSFGTGKSTVAKIFKSRGAKVLDADAIARGFLNKGSQVYKKTVALFGAGILDKAREIDRKKLGDIVFGNKICLKKFNAVIHPLVIRGIKGKLKQLKKGVIVLDAPLLLEAGFKKAVDKVVVVKLSQDLQIKRLIKKKGISRVKIMQIIKSQIPLREKLRLADFIIDNNGSLSQTRKQVDLIRRKLWRN